MATLAATVVATRILARVRLGTVLWVDHLVGATGVVAVAVAPAVASWPSGVLTVQQLASAPLTGLRTVGELSFRQIQVEPAYSGRVEATFVAVSIGATSVGRLIGGGVADATSTRVALMAAALLGGCAAALSLWSTTVRSAMLPAAAESIAVNQR